MVTLVRIQYTLLINLMLSTKGVDLSRWAALSINENILRDRAEVARKAHNLEVIGSIPIPATKFIK